MKIGLVRHFEVIHSCKAFKCMSSEEFQQWQDEYNTAAIKPNPVTIDRREWQICYCSDLSRAIETARAIYGENSIRTELLREVEIRPAFKTDRRLPFILWTVLSRISWFFSRKSADSKRADDFINGILAGENKNILIVSHGALMWYLRKSLLSRGFTGPRFAKAKNGYLYIFEK